MTRILLGVLAAVLLAPQAARAQAEEVVYYHTDAIGSVRAITDATGDVIARYDFLQFGESWLPPASPDPRQFAGKERDAESGLDYFGARYHKAGIGRFTTVDPLMNIEAALLDPQLWNRYSYSRNNPIRFIDPDGLQVLDANLQKMLELLKAPRTMAGAVRGPLIAEAGRVGVETFFGEIFGYRPHAFGGGLDIEEYRQLHTVSSYEKGAWMLGVGSRNAPGIDAVDLTNGRGVSLKTAANSRRVHENAEDGLAQVAKAGFYDVHMYIDAKSVSKNDLNHARIRAVLNDRISKIVVFTKDGPVEFR